MSPAGYVSLKLVIVNGTGFGLVNTNVMVLVPPLAILSGENILLKVGATTGASTTRSAVATVLSGASAVSITPVVLVCIPSVVLVTSTVIIQLPLAGMVPPVILTEGPLLAAVGTTPQVLEALAIAALVISAPGK